MNSRDRVLHHLDGKPVDRLPLMPITMMLACDYSGAKYLDYCTQYPVMVEAQIRFSEDFGFDYVNTMSDPAREAADCGADVAYFEDQPVAINEERALLREKARLGNLSMPEPRGGGRMHNGILALEAYKKKLGDSKIIEGWVEGPIAQAADLRGINSLMMDFYDDPPFVRALLEFVTELELAFALEQARAGADIIGIGDAAASLLGPALYEEFAWPFQKQLVDGIRSLGVRARLHICGDIRRNLKTIGKLGCDIVDLDSMVPIGFAREQLGKDQVLLGNLHPVKTLRGGTPEEVLRELEACHQAAGSRFIIGAGCEIPRGTPLENVRLLQEYAATCRLS